MIKTRSGTIARVSPGLYRFFACRAIRVTILRVGCVRQRQRFIVLAASAFLVDCASVGPSIRQHQPQQLGPQQAQSRPDADSAVSLFDHPWVWTDERGERVAFSRWRGESLVVSAIYATCKSTCPRTIVKLHELTDNFRQQGRAAQFILVTLDPATDTPEDLRRLKASAGFPDTWHLLAGSKEETHQLTDLLDIHVIDDGPHLMHDSRIVVFDAKGRPTRSFRGWALDDERPAH
jgi:cytochrome oxidase Cu insertion factor (SCO1/SenC/PrrC family)